MTEVIRRFGISVHHLMQRGAKSGEGAKENNASESAAEDGPRKRGSALAIHYVHLTKDDAEWQVILTDAKNRPALTGHKPYRTFSASWWFR